MEQNKFIANVTSTVAAVGISVSLIGSPNSAFQTLNISKKEVIEASHINHLMENEGIQNDSDSMTSLERTCTEAFGVMRDATNEEREGVANYIDSISKPTGASFFDL